ncbi:MAG: hypothetical protein CMJ18_21770 [Phycisphaeraceae bacterium]|nr:hypothetical protein [Phycisphaeraceae bacterium]
MAEFVYNNDGFGALTELADTDMSDQDAIDLLVRPMAESDLTGLDWCILTTAEHNCRTRHELAFDGIGINRELDQRVGKVVAHYNARPDDLFDVVIRGCHELGVKIYGNVRLNHALNPERLTTVPGAVNFSFYNSVKKDFRQFSFHQYLAELFEDLLEKGVDGISLDFERKAPFFPPSTPWDESRSACLWFLRRIRDLTDKPIIARVSYEPEKGRPQGQDPLAWMAEGLIDVIVPGTHNHEPDSLDWTFDEFLEAARSSPRTCQVWPQIWPTGAGWEDGAEDGAISRIHSAEAIVARAKDILARGADGVYFFNFCCYHGDGKLFNEPWQLEMFRQLT